VPFRTGWNKARGWFIHLLHLDDTAHRIALGVGLGMFVALTPTVGLQMLLILLLAVIFRANKAAGIPMAWVTNPITIVPMYSLNYYVGWLVVGGPTLEDFQQRLTDLMRLDQGWLHWVQGWWRLAIDMAGPLWVGSIIVGLVLGATSYAVLLYLVRLYRRHHRRRLALRQLKSVSPKATADAGEAAAAVANAPEATAAREGPRGVSPDAPRGRSGDPPRGNLGP